MSGSSHLDSFRDGRQVAVWLVFSYHHHHHVVLVARISLTLSRHFSLSFIASCRSLRLHPVSSHSCRMYVSAGCPAFARPYVGFHRSKSLMSSSLLLQQCPACLVRLTWIVFVMGGRWPYSWFSAIHFRNALILFRISSFAKIFSGFGFLNVRSTKKFWGFHEVWCLF